MGRHREPPAVKMAKGTFRADRDGNPDLIPMPEIVGDAKPPRHLKERGLNYWNLIYPELIKLNVLTIVDLPAFEELCSLMDKIHEMEVFLAEKGQWYTSPKGAILRHPAAIQRTQYVSERNTLMDRFGLNPTSRGKLQIKPRDTKPKKGFAPLGK